MARQASDLADLAALAQIYGSFQNNDDARLRAALGMAGLMQEAELAKRADAFRQMQLQQQGQQFDAGQALQRENLAFNQGKLAEDQRQFDATLKDNVATRDATTQRARETAAIELLSRQVHPGTDVSSLMETTPGVPQEWVDQYRNAKIAKGQAAAPAATKAVQNFFSQGKKPPSQAAFDAWYQMNQSPGFPFVNWADPSIYGQKPQAGAKASGPSMSSLLSDPNSTVRFRPGFF